MPYFATAKKKSHYFWTGVYPCTCLNWKGYSNLVCSSYTSSSDIIHFQCILWICSQNRSEITIITPGTRSPVTCKPLYRIWCLRCVHSWTKVYRFFFNELLHQDDGGKSTICQFRNGNTSYFYKFVKCHRRRRNDHRPVSLNNEQRFKFAMSTYTRPAHHCDQRWTCVLTALRDSHSGPNLQQFQLRQLSPRLTRFHGIVKFYIFIHYIEETKPGHQQFHSISHHE